MTLIKFDIVPKKKRKPIAGIVSGIFGGISCLVLAAALLAKMLFG